MLRSIWATGLILTATACSGGGKDVAIRPVDQGSVAAQDALERGNILFSQGEHALALDAFRRAMRKDPANARALNGVAISYAAMGRHDLAREFFELALARAPGDERIHRNFARSLKAQGRRGEAETLLAQLGGSGLKASAGLPRPTLAQLAAGRPAMSRGATARLPGVGLERVSMGEVRLRTVGAAAIPGTMIARLNTAIVTVADTDKAAPAVTLTPQLNAPIVAKADVEARSHCQAATRKTRSGADAGRVSSTDAVRVKAVAKCPSLAGGDALDSLFEQLWNWDWSQG